jgi:hypothetical protein
VRFADPPRDQLCVLRPEVDDQNGVEVGLMVSLCGAALRAEALPLDGRLVAGAPDAGGADVTDAQ